MVVTKNYNGSVVFLEKDHYIVKDFIFEMQRMEETHKKLCTYYNVLSLGTYEENHDYYTNYVEIMPWIGSRHNMGMGIFVKYDHYNWDYSLQYISQVCLQHKLYTLVGNPRVYHVGQCGVHHKNKNCNAIEAVTEITEMLQFVKEDLYPNNLTILYERQHLNLKLRKNNGGWGDKRDHMLCINITLN